jgi:membrane protein
MVARIPATNDRRASWTPRGIVNFLLRVGRRVSRNNISILSAGVAFYVFLAIPAALTAVFSLYGLAFDTADIEAQLMPMAGLLPADVIALISDLLKTLAARPHGELGAGLALALVVALWGAQSATGAVISALDLVYDEKETRSLVRFQITAFAMALGVIAFALVALSLLGFLPPAFNWVATAATDAILSNVIRWILLVALIGAAIGGVYRFAPDRDTPGGRRSLPGIVMATAFCLLDSWLFSLYVAKFSFYDRSYGSLGAVIVLLLWLYLTVFAILVGAALNFEIEQRSRPPRR